MYSKFTLLLCFIQLNAGQDYNLLEGLSTVLQDAQNQANIEPPDAPELFPEYDFIIVGAGTAGCVVANRLSENPNWKVLLIEAGPAESLATDIPMLVSYLQFTHLNWRYKTVRSNKFCLGLDNEQCNWPRGKVVGGSSVLNYMIYSRGNRRDFDNWSKLGNSGWSFDDVLPYFKKVENFQIPEYRNSSFHSTEGNVEVNYAPYKTQIADAIISSSNHLGINYVDYNGKTQTGVSRCHNSQQSGFRHSSSRAYLHPIRNRPNFHLKKEATVSKILIDPVTKQATGVEFHRNNQKFVVRASREVIVSAGAVGSPQLLMLSGIGPKKHLTKLNIPVISNLKVGYNLMDHIALGGFTFTVNKYDSLSVKNVVTVKNLKDFLFEHKGPITVPGGLEVLLFHDFKNPSSEDGFPDIELIFIGGSVVSDPTIRKAIGLKDEIYEATYKSIEDKDTFMVFPMLLRPKSRGRILLKNTNYKSKPYIFPNYLNAKEDIDTIIQGAYLTINITKQEALQKFNAQPYYPPLTACAKYNEGSYEYLECMLRQFTFTIYHHCGTCKMGPPEDKSAVVDSRLRVYGIKNVRVIDASIMPEITSGHLNAPTFMIAEKGSDMIKADWNYVL